MAIQNIELKILSVLQGETNSDNRIGIKKLTERIYADEVKGKSASVTAKETYDRIRTVRDHILNILKNDSAAFPIKICAPLVEYEENNKTGKRIRKYIDSKGRLTETPVYRDKDVFSASKALDEFVGKKISEAQKYREKPLSDSQKEQLRKIIYCNSIDLSAPGNRGKDAFPEVGEWQIYYQQLYTNTEVFIILSGLMSQRCIEASVLDEIIGKLIKSTSDKYFENFYQRIDLNTVQKTMADEYLSCSAQRAGQGWNPGWNVFPNIKKIMEAIAGRKKIKFERIYYSCDYREKKWFIKRPGHSAQEEHEERQKKIYSCTPLNIFLEGGRYWLLALKDNYNTPEGNFMPCPIDLIVNLSISEEDGCEKIRFADKYMKPNTMDISGDGVDYRLEMKEKRHREYMKTNYEPPEEFDIRLRRNETVGNLILQTFGNDFTFVESTAEYDVIRVVRSPFGIINWALTHARDVVLLPKEKTTQDRLRKKIEELEKIYRNL